MKLTWSSDDPKRLYLFAGDHETAIATLTKANKWWEAWIDLPGVDPDKRYAPLEKQKADVKTKVRRWFESAWVDAPRAQVTQMAELRWDNTLITPEGCLQDAIEAIRQGLIKPNKLLVIALDNTEQEYTVSTFMSNVKCSELVTLTAYAHADFLDHLRGIG